MSSERNYSEAESSPDGRYVRFDEKLGSGAYKDVYLGLDTDRGVEVAWNTVNLKRMPEGERRRIQGETKILERLSHDNIIDFYHVWYNEDKDQICFTTEIMTSGTLKQFASRTRTLKLKVVKGWARQILSALVYLHGHNPPIIHRDLKCDNIFVNGNLGQLRLGDFGLSAARHQTHVTSVLGTPEFMAPELYDERYSEKVDIYAFGMCVLEMITHEYPYEECKNAAQIWKKVTSRTPPDVISRINNSQVRNFIKLCLLPEDIRPSASDLIKHPFLVYSHPSDNCTVAVDAKPIDNNVEGVSNVLNDGSLYGSHSHIQQPHTTINNINDKNQNNNEDTGTNKLTKSAQALYSNNQNNNQNNNELSRENSLNIQPFNPVQHQSDTHNNNNQYNITTTPTHKSDYNRGKSNGNTSPTTVTTAVDQNNNSPPQQRHRTTSPTNTDNNQNNNNNNYNDNDNNQSEKDMSSDNKNNNETTQSKKHAAKVLNLEVEINSKNDEKVNVSLTLYFEKKKKKQVKFDFEFESDTSTSIAQEMTSLFDFVDADIVSSNIAHAIETQVGPEMEEWRKRQKVKQQGEQDHTPGEQITNNSNKNNNNDDNHTESKSPEGQTETTTTSNSNIDDNQNNQNNDDAQPQQVLPNKMEGEVTDDGDDLAELERREEKVKRLKEEQEAEILNIQKQKEALIKNAIVTLNVDEASDEQISNLLSKFNVDISNLSERESLIEEFNAIRVSISPKDFDPESHSFRISANNTPTLSHHNTRPIRAQSMITSDPPTFTSSITTPYETKSVIYQHGQPGLSHSTSNSPSKITTTSSELTETDKILAKQKKMQKMKEEALAAESKILSSFSL